MECSFNSALLGNMLFGSFSYQTVVMFKFVDLEFYIPVDVY